MSDISALSSVASQYIQNAANKSNNINTDDESFDSLLQSAVDMVNETNQLQNAHNVEKLNVALGYSENTHDLTIAQSKASTALTYTIAVRDKFIEAYKEIMNIQI